MDTNVSIDAVYTLSEDVVVRMIEGEVIIIPITSGIGDMDDELYTLNETGVVILEHLDGQKSLRDIVNKLSQEFDASAEEIAEDVIGLVEELLRRRLLIEVSRS